MATRTKTRSKAEAAKETLKHLTAGERPAEPETETDDQWWSPKPRQKPTEQPAEQIGKGALPAEAAEAGKTEATNSAEEEQSAADVSALTTQQEPPDLEDDEEQDEGEEEDDQEAEPVFTDQDRKDLLTLEKNADSTETENAKSWRDIRQRKLWMIHRNADGSRQFKTFDDYCDSCGTTRQSVTHKTNWLAIHEKLADLRSKGADVPSHLSANAVNGLWQLDAAGGYEGSTKEEQEENGLVAVLQEAQEEGLSFSRENLRLICDRRAKYFRAKEGSYNRPAAPNYLAYKRDCLVAKQVGEGGSYGVVKEAQRLPGDFTDNLIKVCTEQNKLPRAEELLQVVTGKALEEIAPRLKILADEIADIENKKNLLKTREAEIRAMQEQGALGALRDEAQALRKELVEKGAIKKKGKAEEEAAAPAPSPANGDADREDAEDEPNQVQDNLAEAIDYLDEAFISDWPQSEAMLQAILDSAKKCEDKLAEITNKAKHLLADAKPAADLDVSLEPASMESVEA